MVAWVFFCYCSTFPGYCCPWGFTFSLSISNSDFLFFAPFKPILLKTEMTFSTNLRGWLNKINLPTYSYFTKEGRSTEHLNFQYHPPAPIRTPYYLSIHSNCYKKSKKKKMLVVYSLYSEKSACCGFAIFCFTRLPSHINHSTVLRPILLN